MVYGIIIDKDDKWHTNLQKLFAAMKNEQLNYKWLISHYDCYPLKPSLKYLLDHEYEYLILSGKELTELAEEGFQWIWGTFSAFDPSVSDEEILNHSLPRNDCYKGFWKLPLTIQHPLAKIELVAFDSTLTLAFTKDRQLFETIKETYPLAEDLEVYNRDFQNYQTQT